MTIVFNEGGNRDHTAAPMTNNEKFFDFIREPANIATLFDSMNDGLIITDDKKKIILVNPAYERITGYSEEELLGKDPKYVASQKTPRSVFEEMWDSMKTKGTWTGELLNRRKSGEEFWSFITMTYIPKDPPEKSYYIGVIRDITERKTERSKMSHMAYHDALTDMPNRSLFYDHTKEIIAAAEKNNQETAVLFLDLDRFKKINDSLGHHAGDELLIKLSQRLLQVIGDKGVVSRFGGDEFAIMLQPISSRKEITSMLRDIFDEIRKPVYLCNQEVNITTSIGVSIYPDHGGDIDTLLKNADNAMYHSKDDGRNTFYFYKNEVMDDGIDRLEIENDLRNAIKKDQLEVFYQLQMNIETGRAYGVEALIRWNHPTRGLLSPGIFLPIAEETEFVKEIDEWVLQTACRDTQKWREEGYSDLVVAVNVSKSLFESQRFIDIVKEALNDTGLPPEHLCLEISENINITDVKTAARQLQTLRKLGIAVSLDDFGTGYSSMGQLKRFPIDILKIDQSFVKQSNGKDDDAAIVKLIINMAKTLRFKIVCEGIETEEQLALVKKEGCHYAQGYLYSKPVTKKECESMLRELHIRV